MWGSCYRVGIVYVMGLEVREFWVLSKFEDFGMGGIKIKEVVRDKVGEMIRMLDCFWNFV